MPVWWWREDRGAVLAVVADGGSPWRRVWWCEAGAVGSLWRREWWWPGGMVEVWVWWWRQDRVEVWVQPWW